MVFESLVTDLINRYLGSYIEALNASQLKIGLLGGNAQLDNLDIKANAFDDLDLPVKVLQGHISSLTLKIPFKNLFTEPTIAELTGLYILIVPNIAVEYDETKEKRYAKELKQKELSSVEAARLKPKNAADDPKADSFGEKLAAQVIKNLQISIKDIHIRYEDSYSIPNRTFSLGLTLSGLTFQTCDSNQKPILIKDESIRQFSKFIKLTSLGVYWNPMSTKFAEKAKVPLRSAMRNSIASPDNLNTGFHYLVKPISSTAMLHVHTRPEETNYSIPQMDLVVNFAEIELCFSLSQYHDITCFLEAQDRIVTQGKYRKYRPLKQNLQNYKVRWHFAYNAILEEFVRRRRRMWSWEHISKHRKISREYIAIWRKKLSGDKLNQTHLANLEAYEEFLDVFNIVLCRQQAELQFNASKQKRDQKANSSGGGGGWFSWFSRGSTATPDDTENASEGDLIKRLATEMTPDEKARLFAAIDYSESAAAGVSGAAINFPASYVSSAVAVTLRQFSLVLLDDKLSDPNVLKFSVNKLTADVKQRAGDQALAVSLRMDSLEAVGAQPTSKESCLAKSSTKPVLITSQINQSSLSNSNNQTNSTSTLKSSHLLCIDFEKNPLDRKADQCVYIQADPLQIVYDAETINKIVHFFTPPKDVHLQELSNTVLSSFEEVKEVTTSGLRHLANNRSYTDVRIDIKPSYFILPDSGVFRSDCRLLLVDLGSFTVNSSRTSIASTCKKEQNQTESKTSEKSTDSLDKTSTKSSGQLKQKSGKLTFDELKDEAYDKFHISLSSVQVIMVNEGDDWRSLRKMDKSSNHILKPLALNCTLRRCLLRNDVNLPRIIVNGCLPVFSVDFTDTVLQSLYELIVNVPFPEANKNLTTPANPDELLKDVVVLPNSIKPGSVLATRDLIKVTRHLNRNDSDSTLSSWISDMTEDDDDESEQDQISQHSKLEADVVDENDGDHDSRSMDKGKTKAMIRQRRDLSNLRRKRAKLIDLKLDFVIRKIEIQTFERQLDSQNKNIEDRLILSFTIHEVGTSLIKRRWSQEIQAHVGSLLVAIPQFTLRETHEPIYLARTKRHEESGHHLLAVQLIIAEKNAPDFDTYYQNTRHRLQCDFKVLDIYIHQEATLLLMNYFNNLRILLSKQSEEIQLSSATEWAASIGDTEGLIQAQQREALENEMRQQLPGRLTAVDAVESHIARKTERRVIRLKAASLAQKTGKIAMIRELNITQWMVNATLDKVNVKLGSMENDLFSTTVNGLRIDVRTTYNTVEVSAILSEFIVIDHILNTSYRKILWVDPNENVVSLQITHFQDATQSVETAMDPDKVDLAISLQIGKLNCIFLYHFIKRVLNFMQVYQVAMEMMLNKVQALSDAAVQQVQEAVDKSSQTRLSLNIIAQAPVIYMPQHSLSTISLMIDFGRITLSNHFEFINSSKLLPNIKIPIPEPGIMLEHTVVKLENLRLSSHPAAYTGALLYSSLSKSFFGKRKIPRNESFHSFGSDAVVDESEHLLSSPNQLLQSYMSISNDHNNNYDDLVNHGAADEIITMEHPMPTTSLSNSNRMSGYSKINSPSSQSSSRPGGESTKKWWHRVSDSCHSGCCCRSTSRKCRTRTLRTTGYDRLLKLEHKMQANLRVCDSNWSDKFSLDTVGSSGRVYCTTKSKMSYQVGVKINLSSSGLTKIVTFMPYFMIINKADIDIECFEVDDTETKSSQPRNIEFIKVPAGEAVPFWPYAINSKNMLLKCRITENNVTAAFPFYESHTILMKLEGKYPGIFVEVETTEETTVITLQMYQEGMALVRLVNHLNDSQPVFYHQSGLQHTVHRLDAGMSIMYAWDCPSAKRELVFYCNETGHHHSNKLTYDCIEEFKVNNTKAYWVSFMWNMQRILLFTQDVNVAKNARLSSDLEPIDQEIVVSLQSIGISLVNNATRAELAYISIISSGVRWSQVKRGDRLKPLQMVLNENLERAYTDYVNASNDTDKAALSIVKLANTTHQPIEVDFNRMMILKPDQYEIRRAFDPGVFLQYKSSISQMQLHGKLFQLQVDSQRLDSTFPVVLSAFPQPKSVALDSGIKPLFECSAIIGRTANPGSFRFKYFRVLIQEMQLKLDQGFLYDITNFFGSTVTRTSKVECLKEEAFKHDYLLITSKLIDSPLVQAHLQDGNRSIFDNFHISPIKVHVSFSLTGSTEGKSSAFPSEVLNLFLQSLGVALTEVQDVVFKLDYFERQACIMTLSQMSTEITHHYVGQGVRQMYVLVLGLDVLGNPFGVLRGLAQGVEDLFYEPVKGAILGPEEFAEGVTLGVRSLFGHAVGGAAGAVSRITGTIGKGIAALTLDEDYKRKRREQLARRPETFGAGLAQGGRGLFMGVFHGVTGMVTKPVEGAKKEGVEGFFKGMHICVNNLNLSV
ncbi:unnamed protein product [Schistosoma turkestanicum]|nr:unnamed protein product [Schistosoma turkestanicum]